MSIDKTYKKVPGTTIFDAEQSAKGYHLNQLCMSFMTASNRERYLADERAYLDEWPLSDQQKQALLDRDLNAAIAQGGNIYFLAKWGATLGLSFQQMAGSMTGMSEKDYRDMMLNGGRSIDGNRIADQVREAHFVSQGDVRPVEHATIAGAVFTSHVPAIGVAWDQHKTQEPYWNPPVSK